MTDLIKTELLTLRPVRRDDATAMAAAVGDLDVSRWLTHVPHPYGIDDANAFIDGIKDDFPAYAAMEHEGQFAGMISAAGELGYWLGKSHWGKGLVLEAAQALIAHHFADPTQDQISSGYLLGNNRSRKILEILGFANVRIDDVVPLSTGVEARVQKMMLTRARWEVTK